MKPTILCVDEDGVLTSAQGHTRLLFGCDDHEMLGLPYHLFLLDRPMDHHIITTWGRQRSGIQVPMHVMEGLDSVDHEVWVHPVFGEQQESILLSYWQMYFQSLAYAAEYSDPDLLSHLQRVAMYTKYMAEQYLHWSEFDVRRAVIAASVHDIGKIAITRSILFRPGPIDGPERAYVQAHTRYGYDLLHDLHTQAQQSSEWMVDDRVFELSKEVALYHHEHFDGTGYPAQIQGEQIPVLARVVHMIDVLDALLSHRSYKEPKPWSAVRSWMIHHAHTHYDPSIIEFFIAHESDLYAMYESTKTSSHSSSLDSYICAKKVD